MTWLDFDYAIIRLVPCAHSTDGIGVGVVMHSPAGRFLRAQFADDLSVLSGIAPKIDLKRVSQYFRAMEDIARGNATVVGALSIGERFHWLTAPRSDILQPGPIHPGRSQNLNDTFQRIFEREIRISV